MTITPRVLLDTSIAQLQLLASFLADEIGEHGRSSEAASLEARACKEVLLTISVLIPKLQAARHVVGEGRSGSAWCLECDDV